MDYKKISESILDLIGGNENISHLTHCATRLRFNLVNGELVKTEDLRNLEGVIGVVSKNGQLQVIIGSDVTKVYQFMIGNVNLSNSNDGAKGKEKGFSDIVDTISGIFTPILPALTAAGMLKAVLAVLLAFKVISNTSQTFGVINFMADATFYFLPILLANSAASRFKTNTYLAMMLGGMLMHPSFIAMVANSKEIGETIRVFGLPVYNATYASSVIPIILGVWLMSKVEPIADRISPNAIKFFTRPLITMFVTGIVTLTVLGPVGYVISNGIANAVNTLNSVAGWIVPTLMGTFLPFLVMTGIHHGLLPIGINNRMTIGFDTIVYPGQLASNIAQGAAALALSIRTKDAKLKQLASATGITAVCGITEPVLFGVTMKHKSTLIASMVGGGSAGFFMGILNVKNYSGGSPGLLTLPSYISVDAPMSNFYLAVAGAAIAFLVSFLVSFILFKDNKDSEELITELSNGRETISSPLNGMLVDLSDVNDPTFSEKIMGDGFAIIPSEGVLKSPFNGTVMTIFNTKHAITLVSEFGCELIIHIGLDTVQLDGKPFDVKVKSGDKVKVGDTLIEFDIDYITSQGMDPIVAVVIANTKDYQALPSISDTKVSFGEMILTLEDKGAI